MAKAFSFQEAKEHHLDVEARRASGAKTLYILNGNQRFEDGYALRSVSLKGVTALGDALPPIDELQRFNAVRAAP